MRALPPGARAYILGCGLAATLCATPALRPGAEIPWSTALPLAALCALVCAGPAAECTAGPVLLAGAMLLPPPAAALIALPAGAAGRVDRPPAAARRLWHAAQLSLASAAASHAFSLAGGRPALAALELPSALLPAAAAALVFGLARAALEGGVLVTAERQAPAAAWGGPLPRSAGPHLVHGLAGLIMALLWHSPYGPAAALLVLLPISVSASVFALCHRERTAQQAAVRALVSAVDLKDRYTRGHSERVGRASAMIARELGMSSERQEALRLAGTLHDVGKLGVPTRLLRKDGPLTAEERRLIELHPELGHEVVRGIGFLQEARAAILHHHERLDGSGYPCGLAGREIPECARVVAVADAFDAMTSTRSYRRARPVSRALEELRRCAGTQFDPAMVRALSRALARHPWHQPPPADPPQPPTPDAGAAQVAPAPGEPSIPADLPVPAGPLACRGAAPSTGASVVPDLPALSGAPAPGGLPAPGGALAPGGRSGPGGPSAVGEPSGAGVASAPRGGAGASLEAVGRAASDAAGAPAAGGGGRPCGARCPCGVSGSCGNVPPTPAGGHRGATAPPGPVAGPVPGAGAQPGGLPDLLPPARPAGSPPPPPIGRYPSGGRS